MGSLYYYENSFDLIDTILDSLRTALWEALSYMKKPTTDDEG